MIFHIPYITIKMQYKNVNFWHFICTVLTGKKSSNKYYLLSFFKKNLTLKNNKDQPAEDKLSLLWFMLNLAQKTP